MRGPQQGDEQGFVAKNISVIVVIGLAALGYAQFTGNATAKIDDTIAQVSKLERELMTVRDESKEERRAMREEMRSDMEKAREERLELLQRVSEIGANTKERDSK